MVSDDNTSHLAFDNKKILKSTHMITVKHIKKQNWEYPQ